MPTMGPMSGEISIAPITTAVEFTFSPTDATRMANMSTHKLALPKAMPVSTSARISSGSAMSWARLKRWRSQRKMGRFIMGVNH